MNFRYFFGVFLSIPLLPVLFVQAILIRRKIPDLPEAKEPSGTSGNPTDPVLKLLILGESTTAGVGVSTHAEGFAGAMANALAKAQTKQVKWQVIAKSGYSARKVRTILIPQIKTEEAPDLIVIGLGGNDAFELNTPWKWRKEIQGIIQALRSGFPAAKLIFLAMPPIRDFPAFTSLIKFVIGNLSELQGEEVKKAVAGKEGVFYDERPIRMEEWKDLLPEGKSTADFFSDGVHPSGLTYRLWAEETVVFLEEKQVMA